jgi:Concanavalin A-like lectin/glucanases superfamily
VRAKDSLALLLLLSILVFTLVAACGDDDDDDSTDDDDDAGDDDDSSDDDDDDSGDDDDDDTADTHALSFDGVDDYVMLALGNWLQHTSYTVEAWVQPQMVGSGPGVIVGSFEGDPRMFNFYLGIEGSAQNHVLAGGHWAGAMTYLTGTSNIGSTSSYIHVAFVFDNGKGQAVLYVGGMREGTGTINGPPGAGGMQIGTVGCNGTDLKDYFAGQITELRISNTARYSKDFIYPKRRFTPDGNTVGLWHFDEGAGSAASEATGAFPDGVIHGASWTQVN